MNYVLLQPSPLEKNSCVHYWYGYRVQTVWKEPPFNGHVCSAWPETAFNNTTNVRFGERIYDLYVCKTNFSTLGKCDPQTVLTDKVYSPVTSTERSNNFINILYAEHIHIKNKIISLVLSMRGYEKTFFILFPFLDTETIILDKQQQI